MNKIEILAPCGSFESVMAAVRSGADAIYLGAKEFSARASAENFDYIQLKKAVDYCHVAGVKVYLTINTIVFDDELEKIKEVIINSAKAKIDAVIVQNIGVATLVKKLVPNLPLHASTQMSVHSLMGAKFLEDFGFKRVVLSREMSKEEIIKVKENCNIELEVFVHGALCMSVSGQCYLSAMLGGRSGNRGRCAQPCRLPFTVDKNKGFDLSLKDNSIIDFVKELQEIDVTSAKIEGRMKRPEYVASAVSACVEARDYGFVTESTKENLSKVFSRTGFTDGYYKNNRGYNMFGYRKKEDVVSATNKLFSQIRQEYKDEKQRVEIDIFFKGEIGKNPILTITDGVSTVEVIGENPCEKAINKPLDKERCISQLSKTGGTSYKVKNAEVSIDENISIPASVLNNMRREAVEKLNYERTNRVNYVINDVKVPEFIPYKSTDKKLYTRVTQTKLSSFFKKADLCFVPLFTKEEELKRLINEGYKIGVEIPRTMFSREEKVIEQLKKVKKLNINHILCNNLAAVYIGKQMEFAVHGGFGLNFVNTLDLIWAEDFGFEDVELSFELTFDRIEKLGSTLKRGIISFGYLPLMVVRNCPNKSKNISCKDCKGKGKMTDRLNKSFIFYCDGECSEILNTSFVDVVDYVEKSSQLDFQTFRFSVENFVENEENILDFTRKTLKSYEKTHGLYLRGVN